MSLSKLLCISSCVVFCLSVFTSNAFSQERHVLFRKIRQGQPKFNQKPRHKAHQDQLLQTRSSFKIHLH